MYIPVIGLEIHIQGNTKSKMFCRCANDYFGKEPNINICPVCFGQPGALPVPNKEAVNKAISFALALNCKINKQTKFDRKNYFYPDLPKGYQISQYDQPLGFDGFVEIEVGSDSRRVRIERIHMEEDTAKSMHSDSGETLIDFNKSGVPLFEVVTKPDFEGVEEVLVFSKRMRQIVRYLNVSDAQMQKGQMRFELNISVKKDTDPANFLPNYKIEVKNIGSISVLEKVIRFEIERQSRALENGEELKSQTRGLKDMSGETLPQRSKETADDYRYFPEPDIPPIIIEDSLIEEIKSKMPELPAERKQRYLGLGLQNDQAEILVENLELGDWLDVLLKNSKDNAKEAAKWLIGDISGWLEKKSLNLANSPVSQDDLIYLLNLIKQNKINGSVAKRVVEKAFNGEGKAQEIIEQEGLITIVDSSEIENFINQVIAENPKIVEDYKKNPNAVKALVGMVMRLSKGKANAVEVERVIVGKIK